MHYDVIPATPAAQLLDDYRAGTSFFLSSPQRTLLAEGTYAVVPSQGGPDELSRLPGRIADLMGDARRAASGTPVVVGAIPFDRAKPAHLIVPNTIRWGSPQRFDSPEASAGAPTSPDYVIRPVPEPEQYARGVERGIARMKAGELDKVVLSRTLHLTSASSVDVHQLLRSLARHNVHGYTFAVDTNDGPYYGSGPNAVSRPRIGKTMIGASPELLVSRKGLHISSNPLAGSSPRSADPVEDRQRSANLLRSAKDRHEHALVVDAVAAALRPYCVKLDVPPEPSLVHTATMWHLSSLVSGELADPSISSMELAAALHPTPAVCGSPTHMARAVINDIEPFDRGFYTGMVGWCDANGDGEWIVTIRCAEVEGRSLRLFAGAGVVAESSAEAELAETSAKFRTMLIALGLQHG
ncbi:isochorismate synthase DhbC [Paenibacillus hemerocallicola]|uniref:isochorismate synthase n=2 Tax=Paenibacillus hemerocallicola TaxID=1172614 RepID=A0A5C4T0U2_9BACL|nr:isochorismate synthase DhbC [Paenibacillus hemerocallicola]